MNAQVATATIELILAPVVMISACCLMLNGLLGGYGNINARLRAFVVERLELLHQEQAEPGSMRDRFTAERLEEIDYQLPELAGRHKILRNAIFLVYCGLVVYFLDMFVIAGSTMLNEPWTANAALIVFLIATALLLSASMIAAYEASRSHRAVMYEVNRVSRLMVPPDSK